MVPCHQVEVFVSSCVHLAIIKSEMVCNMNCFGFFSIIFSLIKYHNHFYCVCSWMTGLKRSSSVRVSHLLIVLRNKKAMDGSRLLFFPLLCMEKQQCLCSMLTMRVTAWDKGTYWDETQTELTNKLNIVFCYGYI